MEAKQPTKKNAHTALNKAVKNINKLIQTGDIKSSSSNSTIPTKSVKSEPGSKATKVIKSNLSGNAKIDGKDKKGSRVFLDRGVVYLAHIPHGFFEEEMKAFFSQFGHVTRLRLVRSHKTGNSRGFAFVEFRFTEVAQVVAETMNNYLMRNRLLKATYIPPEKQTPKMFLHSRNYGPETCIGIVNQRRAVQNQNKSLSLIQSQARVDRHKQHLIKLQEKLKAQGVDCLFQVDEGTSKRLLEDGENAVPSKRARISSPASKVVSSKSSATGKLAISASASKKQSGTTKGQTAQKPVKSIKSVKTVDKSSKKLTLKNEKKKSVEKKAVVKKVKKSTVVKVGASKKDVAKKSISKKLLVKKK